VPDVRTRKILLIAGIIGLAFACVGLSQAVFARTVADFTGARPALIIAWLILMPLFGYMISLRGRARKSARQRALARKAALDTEAARLRTADGVRAAGNGGATPAAEPDSLQHGSGEPA
jgi:apolipoprotein N-acyltransferase